MMIESLVTAVITVVLFCLGLLFYIMRKRVEILRALLQIANLEIMSLKAQLSKWQIGDKSLKD